MKKLKKLLLMIIFLGIFTIGNARTEIEIYSDGEFTNLREKPSNKSKVIAKMENLDSAVVLKKEGNWYYVKYVTEEGKSLRGYVHKSQGTVMEVYEVATKDGYANIRWEPSSNAEIAGTAQNGEEVYVFGKKGDWFHIAYGDTAHNPEAYIHKSQVKKAK